MKNILFILLIALTAMIVSCSQPDTDDYLNIQGFLITQPSEYFVACVNYTLVGGDIHINEWWTPNIMAKGSKDYHKGRRIITPPYSIEERLFKYLPIPESK